FSSSGRRLTSFSRDWSSDVCSSDLWALLLPLAVPPYIIAFAYLDVLHPLGPIQSAVRAIFGINDPRGFSLPDVRSLWGAILLLGDRKSVVEGKLVAVGDR